MQLPLVSELASIGHSTMSTVTSAEASRRVLLPPFGTGQHLVEDRQVKVIQPAVSGSVPRDAGEAGVGGLIENLSSWRRRSEIADATRLDGLAYGLGNYTMRPRDCRFNAQE